MLDVYCVVAPSVSSLQVEKLLGVATDAGRREPPRVKCDELPTKKEEK